MTSPANSETRSGISVEEDAPRVEPWLKVSLGAFVPLALAFVLPRAAQPFLFTLGALLVLCGFVMLVRQERRKVIGV